MIEPLDHGDYYVTALTRSPTDVLIQVRDDTPDAEGTGTIVAFDLGEAISHALAEYGTLDGVMRMTDEQAALWSRNADALERHAHMIRSAIKHYDPEDA